jgi:hypothetical protein
VEALDSKFHGSPLTQGLVVGHVLTSIAPGFE